MLARDNGVANARSERGRGVCCLSTLDSSRYIERERKREKGHDCESGWVEKVGEEGG